MPRSDIGKRGGEGVRRRLDRPLRAAAAAGKRIVPRPEAELKRRRIGAETPVAGGGVHELRVGHGAAAESVELRDAVLAPEEVAVELGLRRAVDEAVAAAEHRAIRPHDHVAAEGDLPVGLHAAHREHAPARTDEHAVHDLVAAPEVDVVGVGRGVHDEVVLPADALRALVVVHSPAAVGGRVDMHDHVVGDDRPERSAERVDSAHVRHPPLADVDDAVEGYLVALGVAAPVAPGPADGDAGVEEVLDLVVRHLGVGRVGEDDAAGGRCHAPAAADEIVVDHVEPHRART